MQVRVHYQGFGHSPWMDQLIIKRVNKLERHLSPSAQVDVFLRADENCFFTTMVIHNRKYHEAFSAQGYNLLESFSRASEKAVRVLADQKRKLKDRIHHKFISRDDDVA